MVFALCSIASVAKRYGPMGSPNLGARFCCGGQFAWDAFLTLLQAEGLCDTLPVLFAKRNRSCSLDVGT